MEQFRQIGEALGSLNALMILHDDIQINQRQCCLLFDLYSGAFERIAEEIKHNLKLEEKCSKWKALEQPLREILRVFKEGESYIRNCLETDVYWWAKALSLNENEDCVEFHVHNLFCCFPVVIEAIETAGEISGLDLDDMQKKRVILTNKYDNVWNDPKLFHWKFGKQYLVSDDMCHRLQTASTEDKWLLYEKIKGMKTSHTCKLSKYEQRLVDFLLKKLNGSEIFLPSSVLTGSNDYEVRRRLGGGSEYKEIQWLREAFAIRHFYGEAHALNPEISLLMSLSHPNVLRYLCGFHDEDKKEYFLVMELMSKNLNTYVKEICGPKRRLPFSLPVAVDVMLQIARGMEYLHGHKIYHGDLNPLNVLIKPRISSPEGYIHVKISRFGLNSARTNPHRSSSPNQNETPQFIWYAPEVLAEQENTGASCKLKNSEKADVYSFGMLCFEVLTGKVPFEDGHLQGDKMSRNIRAGERPLFPFALPKYLATLTKRCWQTDPLHRPSFSSICRILLYIKRLMVLNPHLARPELPAPQVDFCDIKAGFVKKFCNEAFDPPLVSHIPFHFFAYRLAEKEKLHGISTDKNWESASEVVPSGADGNANSSDDTFPPLRDTRSVCSEIPDKKLLFLKKPTSTIADDSSLATRHVTMVCSEIPQKKVPMFKKSKSVTATTQSMVNHKTRSNCSDISVKRASPLQKCSTLPSSLSDTRSICSEIPDSKSVQLRKSNSVKSNNDPVKTKGTTRSSLLNPRGRSARINTERQPLTAVRHCRCGHKPGGHLTDSEASHP